MLHLEFWILFFHILFCLFCIKKIFYSSIFQTILSPLVWKVSLCFNILAVLALAKLPISFLFIKLPLLYSPLVLIYFSQSIFIFTWRQQLYFQFECFLNNLIAQVKIGTSFRSAFKKAIFNLPNPKFHDYFIKILDIILFSKKQKKNFYFAPVQQIITELKRTDQSAQCLNHLENIRHQFYIQSIFRKKVHSALLQIRVQSFVLWILYSGIFIFILHRYGLKYIKVLLVSLTLFITGLIILFHCGRKIKWTI